MDFPVAQMVKNLGDLGWEDPLKKGMAVHPSILAWRIPWTEKHGGLQSVGSQRVGHDWAANTTWLIIPSNYYLFSWAPKSPQSGHATMELKDTCFLEEKLGPT